MKKLLLALTITAVSAPVYAQATITTFSSQSAFLSATGAASATGVIPDFGLVPSFGSATVGQVTFTDPDGLGFFIGGAAYYHSPAFDWTTRYAGNEIAINSTENLNVAFNAPVYSAGFDFIEPGAFDVQSPYANDLYYPYMDSIFTVTLKSNSATVGSFTFNAPDNVASFIGVWSSAAFNRMEIRETTGGIEDEYFGQFYAGNSVLPVPEPETYGMLLAGLGLLGFAARRRKK